MATVLLLFAMSGWAWVAFTFALLDTLPVAVGFHDHLHRGDPVMREVSKRQDIVLPDLVQVPWHPGNEGKKTQR